MVEFSWLNDIQGVGGGGGGGFHRGGSRGDHSKTGSVTEKGCNGEVQCIELFPLQSKATFICALDIFNLANCVFSLNSIQRGWSFLRFSF